MKAKYPDIDNQPREEFDSANPDSLIVLDQVSGVEKIKLIKEAAAIRLNLQTVQSSVEKLKMVKRVSEIRGILGLGGGDDEKPKPNEPEVQPQPATTEDVNRVMPLLKQFIGEAQLLVISSAMNGEDGQSFKDKLIEIANTIQAMLKTYGQDGMGDDAIAYLHYFKGSGDWYITEKDMEDEQLQAFGLANLGQGGELGYISIQDLIDAGVELDLHWNPKTLKIIRGGED
ncbi:DUF2958 domain-containing protein [Nitrosomonas oligotropha]|uniref:DUF2958 domain-containing protein n=1 Tax=Nitrosomonas oligotropha TaxID=42354 RepID=UPI001960B1F2|nr:DUF2958 domain-containing protein [Nitrosomonas oligotropha]